MTRAQIIDYTSLISAVEDWLWRAGDTNVDNNAGICVDNFEREFKDDFRAPEMQQNVTGTLTNSSQVPIPADHLETLVFQLTGLPAGTPNQVLTYVTAARSAQLDSTTQPSGVPKWFTIKDGNFIVSPQSWVTSGTTWSLDYYGFTHLAAAPNGVNWLVTKRPNLYLYGSLMQAAAYIDDKETVAFWTSAYDRAGGKYLESIKKAKVVGPLVMLPSMGFRTQRQRIPRTGF